MKRLRRIILNTFTVLSLLLCLATVGLWVRSYWLKDTWIVPANNSSITISSGGGSLHVGQLVMFPPPNAQYVIAAAPGHRASPYSRSTFHAPQPQWRFLGFAGMQNRTSEMTFNYLRIPDWAIVSVTAIAPAAWLMLRRAIPPGLCPSRRYNLTGNVSGVCPECGVAIEGTA